MGIKITIGVPFPALMHAGKPAKGVRPRIEVAENSADAAKRLNQYVQENSRKAGPNTKGPKGGFTEHMIIRAIQNVEDLKPLKQIFGSGIKTRTITLEYTDSKPSPKPISVSF